jgi:hypothetical protein
MALVRKQKEMQHPEPIEESRNSVFLDGNLHNLVY